MSNKYGDGGSDIRDDVIEELRRENVRLGKRVAALVERLTKLTDVMEKPERMKTKSHAVASTRTEQVKLAGVSSTRTEQVKLAGVSSTRAAEATSFGADPVRVELDTPKSRSIRKAFSSVHDFVFGDV